MNRKLLTAALTLTACAPAPPLVEDVTLTMNENESAPLAGVLQYSADLSVRPRFTLSSEGEEDIVVTDAPANASGPTPLLGMRADREYTVSVSFEPEAGGAAVPGGDFTLTTPPLPDDFPPIEVTTIRPARMEPGYQFVPTMRWTKRGPDREFGLVFALDAAGEVVWYFRTDKSVNDVKRLPNGDLIYLAGRDGRMVQEGSPEDLRRQPRDLFVASFFGGSSLVAGERTGNFLRCADWAFPVREGGEDGPATVVLLPDELEVAAPGSGDLQGTVRSVALRGGVGVVEVSPEGGSVPSLWALASPGPLPSPGDPVGVRFRQPPFHCIQERRM